MQLLDLLHNNVQFTRVLLDIIKRYSLKCYIEFYFNENSEKNIDDKIN